MLSNIPPDLTDKKSNVIRICLFESWLAKITLNNQEIFKDACMKMLDDIKIFCDTNNPENIRLKKFLTTKPKKYNFDRELYSIFSMLKSVHPKHESFEDIKNDFSISAFFYFIKSFADVILKSNNLNNSNSFFHQNYLRSPIDPDRIEILFSAHNRGVRQVTVLDEHIDKTSLGIVCNEYQPAQLKNYFDSSFDSYPAKYLYIPHEESYVAKWMRARMLPIISGASGSTELLLNRIIPLCNLEHDEINLILFAQAMDMVAQGHHSFFESIIVAEHLGFNQTLTGEFDLISLYLSAIPEAVQQKEPFNEFLNNVANEKMLSSYKITITDDESSQDNKLPIMAN